MTRIGTGGQMGKPAEVVLEWLLDLLAGHEQVDESGYRDRFGPRFVAAVPYPAFMASVEGLAGEWEVEAGSVLPHGPDGVKAVISFGDRRLQVTVTVADDERQQVTGLRTVDLAPVGSAPTVPAERDLPDTLAGEALCWFLDLLDGRRQIDREEYGSRFAEPFVAKVPFDTFVGFLPMWAGANTVLRHSGVESAEGIVAVVGTDTTTFQVTLARLPAEPYPITSLLWRPASPTPVELRTLEDLGGPLAPGYEQAWLLAKANGDGWVRRAGSGDDRPMPLGSVFKLYILGALAIAVDAGRLAWDQPVMAQDRLRNEITRGMGRMPAGEQVSVRRAAEMMIGLSCNTATDHLLDLVGREAVEQATLALGHHDPTVTIPFLYAREAFLLKWGIDPAVADEYVAASATRRRELLDDLARTPLTMSGLRFNGQPRLVDEVEWFATPADVCRALIWLAGHSDEVANILAANPGVARSQADRWAYVGHKGGSEPGVATSAWYLRPHQGAATVFVLMLYSTDEAIDQGTWMDILYGIMPLLTPAQ